MSFGLKPAGTPDPAQDYFESPAFQWMQQQNILQQQQQNQNQQAYNQIAQQNSATDQARLGLDKAQMEFQQQQGVSNLLMQLLGQQVQNLYAQQSGARNVGDLAQRLIDTRYNVQRTNLLDQLRLAQARDELNRIIDSPASRARRLIGG